MFVGSKIEHPSVAGLREAHEEAVRQIVMQHPVAQGSEKREGGISHFLLLRVLLNPKLDQAFLVTGSCKMNRDRAT